MSTTSKDSLGGLYPSGGVASGWDRMEPLIDAQRLKDLHLFGVPLVSAMRDPATGKPSIMSLELIDEKILDAIALTESELGMQIFPAQHNEKYPFDRNLFQQLGYFKLRNRPVCSIQELMVTPSNGIDIYSVPLDWVETANIAYGQINIIPLNIATVGGSFAPTSTVIGGGAFFLSILGQRPWIPAFWRIKYTTGFPDGLIPRMFNQLIGAVAAMEILSLLAATHARSTSHSASIDSISQSVSTPGPQLFMQRIQELAERKKMLIGKIKAIFGTKIFSSEV